MNSEKVKEIKKALEFMMKLDLSNKLPYIDGYTPKQIAYEEIFNYINELESENKTLKDQIIELEDGIAKSMLGCEFLPECTNDKLKQFTEMLKEKVKDYEALTYKNNEVTYHNLELDIDETLKEFKKVKVQNYE